MSQVIWSEIQSQIRGPIRDLKVCLLTSDFCIVPPGLFLFETFAYLAWLATVVTWFWAISRHLQMGIIYHLFWPSFIRYHLSSGHLQMLFIYPPIWLLAFIHQTVTNVDKWSLGQYFSVFSSPPGLDRGYNMGTLSLKWTWQCQWRWHRLQIIYIYTLDSQGWSSWN